MKTVEKDGWSVTPEYYHVTEGLNQGTRLGYVVIGPRVKTETRFPDKQSLKDSIPQSVFDAVMLGSLGTPRTITITAKCSDNFDLAAEDAKGKFLGDYSGYVPSFFPSHGPDDPHSGDFIELTIDLKTGEILNWIPPGRGEVEKLIAEVSS